MVSLFGTIAVVLLITPAVAPEAAAIDPTTQVAPNRLPSIGPA